MGLVKIKKMNQIFLLLSLFAVTYAQGGRGVKIRSDTGRIMFGKKLDAGIMRTPGGGLKLQGKYVGVNDLKVQGKTLFDYIVMVVEKRLEEICPQCVGGGGKKTTTKKPKKTTKKKPKKTTKKKPKKTTKKKPLTNGVNPCSKNNGGCDKLRKCSNVKGKAVCANCPKGYTKLGATKCKKATTAT